VLQFGLDKGDTMPFWKCEDPISGPSHISRIT